MTCNYNPLIDTDARQECIPKHQVSNLITLGNLKGIKKFDQNQFYLPRTPTNLFSFLTQKNIFRENMSVHFIYRVKRFFDKFGIYVLNRSWTYHSGCLTSKLMTNSINIHCDESLGLYSTSEKIRDNTEKSKFVQISSLILIRSASIFLFLWSCLDQCKLGLFRC